ncbi:site-specific DNA-methyltransferase [Mycoplasma sp. MV126]|uniref:site-specific DNA-methyltransferase n=1 Tax=Mycoplasma sp. MV126 TaxID=3401676 RepID=UPI003AAF93F4
MNNEKKQIILNWLKQQEETDSLTQEQRDIFALIRESLHTKKYGLVFEEKEEDIVNEANNSILTLKQKDLIIANNNAKKLNYLLEGDNYQALKLLQKTHRNRIDVIYIDPPYNTGNKDFIYNDAYVDSEDAFRHSKWLSFMKKRLELAKELLSEKGVIFISIDDNEQSQLKLLCDEIFGENNFISNLAVEINPKGRKNSDFISKTHEYCLIYAKRKSDIYFLANIPKASEDMSQDENGDYIHNSGKRILVGENKFNKFVTDFNSKKHYSVYYNKNKNDIVIKKENNIDDLDETLKNMGYKRYISYLNDKFVENTYTADKFIELFNTSCLFIRENKIYEKNKNDSIRIKSLLVNKKYEAIINNKKTIYEIDLKTTSAKQLLTKIIGSEIFSYPKNVFFIKLLISLYPFSDAIILDFFAGSGTTGHAVAKLNAEDGGDRAYILCTNNENNICEDVTFKRLSNIQEELPHNLIYQKVNSINKSDFIYSYYGKEYLDQLDASSLQLAQLQLGKLIDNKEILYFETQEEFNNYSIDDLLNAKFIFINENKIDLNECEVYDQIQNKVISIPNAYYEKELKEVGYLW